MKREGRQHGMVRCHYILPDPMNPRPETRYVNRFDSPPTAGLFTRVTTKPTNHSKYTGKCGRTRCRHCHDSPANKSKEKTKGTNKIRVGLVGSGSGLSGLSATGLLGLIDGEGDNCVDEMYESLCEIASSAVDLKSGDDCVDEIIYENSCEIESLAVDFGCGVEVVCDDEDEGWCFVEETF